MIVFFWEVKTWVLVDISVSEWVAALITGDLKESSIVQLSNGGLSFGKFHFLA